MWKLGYKFKTFLYKNIAKIIYKLNSKIESYYKELQLNNYRKDFKYIHPSVTIYHPVHIEPKGMVSIFENVSIAPFVQIWALGEVTIGKNTLIASHVIITTSTHDYNIKPLRSKRIDKPIVIGEDVWIGSGAIIFPGVKIEDGAVIGAGAVVLKDVEKNAIVVGNPARVLKYRK